MKRMPEAMPAVTTSDLSRRPGDVLDRIAQGERLVVCRHKTPVATLQPLDGYVFQPFSGAVHDVFGWPVGGIEDQIADLSEIEHGLLCDCYKRWRVWPGDLWGADGREVVRTVEEMKLKGLVRKTPRGLELTGRGLALHEALMKQAGREAELFL